LARRPRSRGGRLVTLTSDVGWAYAAQMKAALIAGGVDPSQVVDLAHDLPGHGVEEAAFLLREMARGFPPSTVHLAVIDPGVGGRRAPIAIATKAGPLLVGPDNGLLVPLAEELGVRAAYRIDPARLRRRPAVGTTFDGRMSSPPRPRPSRAVPVRRSWVRPRCPSRTQSPRPSEPGPEPVARCSTWTGSGTSSRTCPPDGSVRWSPGSRSPWEGGGSVRSPGWPATNRSAAAPSGPSPRALGSSRSRSERGGRRTSFGSGWVRTSG